ncbi:hypothetical protein [Actinoplanes aureus]|uniref:Uncharacterized protein n=1 Tax=Actinoplanes aureus TaxID=2792083 RepID=A0A931CIB0_9ACTN|nr:hypothetical protein [Actinoplanes aureus]MBG0567833.1 hypothetical protein [Actinoplanes aureus]
MGTIHGIGGLIISVRPGDGMTSAADTALAVAREELGRNARTYCLRGEAGVGQQPEIIESGLFTFASLTRLARRHRLSTVFRFASPWGMAAILAVSVALGVASTILTRLLSPRSGQQSAPAVTDFLGNPAFLLTAGLAAIVGVSIKYVGERIKPGAVTAARRQLIADLHDAEESTSERWKAFINDAASRLAPGKARLIVVDGFETLDTVSRRVIREYLTTPHDGSGPADVWIVFEGSYSPELRTSALASWTGSSSPLRKMQVYDLLPLTAQERERLALRLGHPERASYTTVRAICAPDTLPDQAILDEVDRYRNRQPAVPGDYDALDLFYLLAVAAIPDGGLRLSRDFLAKRLSDSAGTHAIVFQSIFSTRPMWEDVNIRIAELVEHLSLLLNVADDGTVAVDLEVADLVVRERHRWALPEPGLVQLFWALLWWRWLAGRDPNQPFWVHRLAGHIVRSAAPGKLRNLPEDDVVSVHQELLSASLGMAAASMETCLMTQVPALLDRVAYQLDPRSGDESGQLSRALELGWFAWAATGDPAVLRRCVEMAPERPNDSVTISEINSLYVETLPGLGPDDRRRAEASLAISEQGGSALSGWQRMYIAWLLLNLAKATALKSWVGPVMRVAEHGITATRWLREVAYDDYGNEAGDGGPGQAIRLMAMADAAWVLACSHVHWLRSDPLQSQLAKFQELVSTSDFKDALVAAIDASDVTAFGTSLAGAKDLLEMLPEIEAGLADPERGREVRQAAGEMLSGIVDEAESTLAETRASNEFLRECAAKQALVVAAAATNLMAGFATDAALIDLTGRCLGILGAGGTGPEVLDEAATHPIIERYLQIVPVAWRAFGMEALSSLAEMRRMEYHLIHMATHGTVNQLRDASEAFASGAVQRGCAGVTACLVASASSEASDEVAARHIVRAAECCANEDLGSVLTADLCLLAVAAAHAYSVDLSLPIEYLLEASGEDGSAGALPDLLDRADDAVFGQLARGLLNATDAVADTEQARSVLRHVEERARRIDDADAAQDIRRRVEIYQLKAAIRSDRSVDVPSLIDRWRAQPDVPEYAYLLYLLLDADSPHAELLSTEAMRALPHGDGSDSAYPLLATQMLRIADDLDLGPEQRSLAARVLVDALPVWEQELGVDASIAMLEELVKHDPEQADYRSRLARRKTIKLSNDQLKLAEWRRQRAYFREFSYYVSTLAFYGLPITSDAPTGDHIIARWKAEGGVVPDAFVEDESGRRVSLRFVVIGRKLHSPPADSDATLSSERAAFNAAAHSALLTLLHELSSLPDVPEAIRELLLRQRSSLRKPTLPRQTDGRTPRTPLNARAPRDR